MTVLFTCSVSFTAQTEGTSDIGFEIGFECCFKRVWFPRLKELCFQTKYHSVHYRLWPTAFAVINLC